MAPVSQVAQGIYAIDVQGDRKFLSATAYLVVGEKAALIETGPTSVVPDLVEGMRQAGWEPSRLAYIIPTHIHLDHGGGVGALVREAPQAQVVVHQRGARHLIDPSRLIESTIQTQGEAAYQASGPVLPVPQERVWPVSGGEVIPLGGRELLIIDAPGHAPHQICIYDRLTGGLFPGDAVGMLPQGQSRPMPVVVPPSFDLGQYLDTLRRIRELKPSVLYLSHYGASREVDRYLDMTEEDVQAYGRIVQEAMREGASYGQTVERLEAYRRKVGVPASREEGDFRLLIAGFAVYFKRQDPSLEMPR